MKPAAVSPELADLASAAAAADAGLAPPAGDTPGQQPDTMSAPVDPAKEWAQLPAMFGSLVSPFLPELRDVYTDAACRRWGEAMVPLAEKYGWNVNDFLAWLGPWIGVGMATWPLAVPTYQAVKSRRQAKPAEKPKPEAPAQSATVVQMPRQAEDPDLRDPTQTNRPPRPAE